MASKFGVGFLRLALPLSPLPLGSALGSALTPAAAVPEPEDLRKKESQGRRRAAYITKSSSVLGSVYDCAGACRHEQETGYERVLLWFLSGHPQVDIYL